MEYKERSLQWVKCILMVTLKVICGIKKNINGKVKNMGALYNTDQT